MHFVKEQFVLTNKYIKDNILRIFVILLIIFLAISVMFYILMISMPQYAKEIYNMIAEMFESKNVIGDDGSISALGLFINNFWASLMTYLYGFIPFFFFSAWSIVLNSSVVGLTLGVVDVITDENIFLSIIKYILPHGIFEIPALILSSAAGTRLCLTICKKIFGKAKDEKILFHLKNHLRLFVFYIIPFLIIAAFIEGVVLPFLFM